MAVNQGEGHSPETQYKENSSFGRFHMYTVVPYVLIFRKSAFQGIKTQHSDLFLLVLLPCTHSGEDRLEGGDPDSGLHL